MSNLVTVHNLNGKEAITTTVERLIQELIALGELEAIIHELVKCGALDRVIHLLSALKVMSVARAIDDKGDGYKQASSEYKEAYNKVIDMVTPKTAAKSELQKSQRTDAKLCKECGHLVLWLKGSEKSVPVFTENVGMKETVFNPDVHKTHYFNDCKRIKGAGKFKRPDGVTTDEQAQLFDK
jgi:hypothetical protein